MKVLQRIIQLRNNLFGDLIEIDFRWFGTPWHCRFSWVAVHSCADVGLYRAAETSGLSGIEWV